MIIGAVRDTAPIKRYVQFARISRC